MGFIKNLIGLTIAETACNAINSKISKRKREQEQENLETLSKLKELYDSGAITKKEYEKKKKEILSRH